MPEAEVTAEAQEFLMGTGDAAFLQNAYPQVLREMSHAMPIFTFYSVIQGQSGVGVYSVADTVAHVLTVVYFPTELEPAPVHAALDLRDPTWRTASGPPKHWTQELERRQDVRVTPIPAVTGALADIPGLMGLEDEEALTNNFIVFYAAEPLPASVPQWAEGPAALRLAAKDAARDSETKDLALSQALGTLAGAIEQLYMDVFKEYGELD